MLAVASQAQEGTFGETTSVLVVEVPVHVVKDGRPVTGLTAADFALYDDGRRVEDFGFEVLEFGLQLEVPGQPPVMAGARPSLPGRNLLFVYDFSLNSNRRMLHSASAAIREALGERLGRDDRLAIALFRGYPHLQYVLDFTSDRRQILAALEVVDLMMAGDFRGARSRLGELRALGPPAPNARRFGSGWGLSPVLPLRARRMTGTKAVPSDPLTAEALALFDHEYVLERKLVLNFIRALSAVGESTRDLTGQKNLILFSTGYPDYLLFGDEGTVGTLSAIRRVFDSFREHNWTLHGLDTGLRLVGSTALFHLADETGGAVFTNSHDLGLLLGDMLERTEIVYVLTFQPQEVQHDGRFRRLRVELVGGPRGARVLHRPAYRMPAAK